MGATGKPKRKTDTAKARERKSMRDLAPKDARTVRGGLSDISVVKKYDKTSPS
jgi:hypothetical protein